MAGRFFMRAIYKSGIILVMCVIIVLTVNGIFLTLSPHGLGDEIGLYEATTTPPQAMQTRATPRRAPPVAGGSPTATPPVATAGAGGP